MMSACKQYGVNILLSQAVQELMSETARSKLRHLDTVTVKGSSLYQEGKPSPITAERIQKLESVGFKWAYLP
jgi:hypothetical protein